jgi:biofilm PGA synthesis N-glycosyltransferase PgaC
MLIWVLAVIWLIQNRLFFGAKGLCIAHARISGDDDLFVNQNATPNNTAIEIHPDTFTYTDAKTTLGGWFRQKKRHMGVGKLYKNNHRRMLSFDAVSGFLFYVLFILCLVFKFEPILALVQWFLDNTAVLFIESI